MKVSVSNNPNKPAPWIPSLIGGLFNLAGAGASVANQQVVNQQQMQHDKEMAGINQHNTLEQMEVQNQYQVDQWNRENEYNDPGAVAARYRAAGISPHAALGGSASGAGIAGGLSSAPSGGSTGSSSSLSTSASGALAGLGSSAGLLVQSEMNKINRERMEADREKTYQEAKKVALENQEKEYMRDAGVWDSMVSQEKSKRLLFQANAIMASIRSLNYDRENRADIEQKEAAAKEMLAKVKHYDALISQIEELTPAQKEELLALADKYREDARAAKQGNDYFDKIGFRPGMDLEQALVSIAGKVGGVTADEVKKWLSDKGLSGTEKVQLPPTAEQTIRATLDEYDKAEKDRRGDNKHVQYQQYKFRLLDNLARSFKY